MARGADALTGGRGVGLEDYWQKRDFGRTPEPRGGSDRGVALAADAELRYVVQKHDATRLHYDFRLEHDGVLLSWAVPRGPSLVPGERRLAVRTEDHPLEYGDFEGVIPEDEYGGGTVMLWDVGTWEPVLRDGPHEVPVSAQLARGKLKLVLHGERLRGAFVLVRTDGRGKGRGRAGADEAVDAGDGAAPEDGGPKATWLLLKQDDAFARRDGDALLAETMTSVTSGRSMEDIARGSSTWHSHKPRARAAGGAQGPVLAAPTPAEELPEGPGWLFEPVVPGRRGLLRVEAGEVTWTTPSGERGPAPDPARAAVRGLAADAALDVVLRPDGVVFAVDLLELEGDDLRALPLAARLAALGALVAASEVASERLAVAPHTLDRDLAALSGEVVAKRLDAAYEAGRTGAWRLVDPTSGA